MSDKIKPKRASKDEGKKPAAPPSGYALPGCRCEVDDTVHTTGRSHKLRLYIYSPGSGSYQGYQHIDFDTAKKYLEAVSGRLQRKGYSFKFDPKGQMDMQETPAGMLTVPKSKDHEDALNDIQSACRVCNEQYKHEYVPKKPPHGPGSKGAEPEL